MREIVWDTETTGIFPGDGHRIVEIGAVEMIGKVVTGRTFHTYIDPCRAMPKDAQAVHGLSTAFLTGQPVFEMVVDEFLAFIGDAPLVAHNAAFDMEFLNYELKRANLPLIPHTRSIDTLEISRKINPGAKHTLDALCSRYGIDLSGRTKHGALIDAELLARVYVELTGGRQIGFDLATEAVEVELVVDRVNFGIRDHVALPEELERHAAFVATLKDPVWLQ
ncbi:DNA polymerase III subunit epsilon [Polymorphobacter fuscus]|uniref:DNA polymerase III subunit epsilon n=1 Tax=Sandarakinorhabdus fusca TaxID=1439888 RepID=A0A7C9GNP3_9SPHN|nr:DNA polymerase III subunit epsilon [Polymorphobacter fuscus]KAB7647652.1 DNA polymerase III subunit epsilon [Polymorphobacter fuscus]MQT16935.1 DNA polymerase III subunit epsilon [Polymorphobacter fuscus]NJC09075.1 DNA polymerase-3 subunit epsilon [Polymorphobacter fuscus]